MSITQSGLFTADTGAGAHTITATVGGVVGQAIATVAAASWTASVNATTYDPIYDAVVANVAVVHIISGLNTVAYGRSTDNGVTFSPLVSLGSGTPYLERPLAISGLTLGLATVNANQVITDFFGQRNVGDISIRRSTDAGVTWTVTPIVATAGAKALRMTLSISPSTSIWQLVWMDYRNNRWDIYHARSLDAGLTWEASTLLVTGTNSIGAERPVMAVNGADIHVAWMDGRDNKPSTTIEGGTVLPFSTEIYYKKSTDSGATWGADIKVTNSAAYAGRPDISVLGSGVVVMSYDYRPDSTGNEIGIKRSTDGGATWSAQQLLTNVAGDSTHSFLANSATAATVYCAYKDTRAGLTNNFMRKSVDSGATWGTEEQISETQSHIPAIFEANGYLHGVWRRADNGFLQYRRKTL